MSQSATEQDLRARQQARGDEQHADLPRLHAEAPGQRAAHAGDEAVAARADERGRAGHGESLPPTRRTSAHGAQTTLLHALTLRTHSR
jgi:hypothetical protein